MKEQIRLSLPPLAEWEAGTCLNFVRVGRDGRVLHSGCLNLAELAHAAQGCPVTALLHPQDVVVARVAVPPMSRARLAAALPGILETMALSPFDELAVGHGPRGADGHMVLAWVERAALAAAGQRLEAAGLGLAAILPRELLIADAGEAQDDAGRQAPLPAWSLPWDSAGAPQGAQGWRRALFWLGAALFVWTLGLNLEAHRLGNEVREVQALLRSRMQDAPPGGAQPASPQGLDFLPVARRLAQAVPGLQGQVQALDYRDGLLSLRLVLPSVPPPAAILQVSDQGWTLESDEADPSLWRLHAHAPREGRP